MIDLLKFDLTASNRTSAAFRRMKEDLGGVKGAVAGVNDYANRAGRKLRNLGAGLTAGVTGSITGIGLMVDGASRSLSDLDRQADVAGLSIQRFKVLSMAARDYGIQQDKMSDILKDSNDKIGDFLATGGGPLADFFENIGPKVGLAAKDFEGLGADQALKKYVGALEDAGLSQQQMTFYMEALASDATMLLPLFRDNGAAITDMAERSRELGLSLDKDIGDRARTARRDLGIVSDVIKTQFSAALTEIVPIMADLAKEAAPMFKSIVTGVRDAVTWFRELSPEAKRTGAMIAGIAAVGGPLLTFLGMGVMGLASLTKGLIAMGSVLMAHPVIAAIALIAGGAYLIYQNWDKVSAFFVDLWDSIKTAASDGWASIKAKISEYAPEWLKAGWRNLTAFYATLWSDIKDGLKIGWDAIKGLLEGDYSVGELVHKAWKNIGTWFSDLSDEVKQGFVDIWDAIKEEVSSWPERFLKWGKDSIAAFVDGIFSVSWKDTLSNWMSGEDATAQGGPLAQVRGSGRDQAQGMIDGMDEMLPAVEAAGRRLGQVAEDGVRSQTETQSPSRVFMRVGEDLGDGLTQGIASKGGEARAAMASIGDELAGSFDTVKEGIGSVGNQFSSMISGLIMGTKKASSVLKQLGTKLLDKGISQLLDSSGIGDWLGSIFGGANANGNAFSGGRVTPFASGGVVSSPSLFPMAGGKLGLMGEAGPEAIMPLARGSDGKLGVRSSGGGAAGAVGVSVQVNNYASDTETRQTRRRGPNGEEVIIDVVNKAGSAGKLTGVQGRYNLKTQARRR